MHELSRLISPLSQQDLLYRKCIFRHSFKGKELNPRLGRPWQKWQRLIRRYQRGFLHDINRR